MSDVVKNLIQYVGITNYLPENSTVFKQLSVEKKFCIPEAKPDIEQIIKAISELKIKSTKVIKTPRGTSMEGQLFTGLKMVVEGVITQKIQYVADEPVQSVHAAHTDILFSSFIVLPVNFVLGTPITINGYIEDIFVQKMDERCIFNNISILLTADFC